VRQNATASERGQGFCPPAPDLKAELVCSLGCITPIGDSWTCENKERDLPTRALVNFALSSQLQTYSIFSRNPLTPDPTSMVIHLSSKLCLSCLRKSQDPISAVIKVLLLFVLELRDRLCGESGVA
jgi:hypothetical protein